MDNPHISVVSPVYMGEKMVHELVSRVIKSVSQISTEFEIILVNDASPDNSWDEILKECKDDQRVKGINLSRNFGQHKAIKAGLKYVKGDWCVIMDCDLQDQPEEIIKLYSKAQEGYDIVRGEREIRKDGVLKKLSSKVFHRVYNYLSGVKTNEKTANFGIFKNCVISVIREMSERDSGLSSLLYYVGFKATSIPIEHSARFEGTSSYTLVKLMKLAFGVIISNTNKPLRMTVAMGFFFSCISMLMAAYNLIAYWCGMIKVPGFTTTVFSIWFVGGVILMQLGVVGLYIGKVFDQVKGRPLFVVKDEVNIQ